MSCTGIEKTTEASLNAKRKSLQWNIFRMSICLISILIASASLKSEIQDHNKFYCCSQNLLKKQQLFSFETQIIFFSRQRLCLWSKIVLAYTQDKQHCVPPHSSVSQSAYSRAAYFIACGCSQRGDIPGHLPEQCLMMTLYSILWMADAAARKLWK